jgi:hypothetical protein
VLANVNLSVTEMWFSAVDPEINNGAALNTVATRHWLSTGIGVTTAYVMIRIHPEWHDTWLPIKR